MKGSFFDNFIYIIIKQLPGLMTIIIYKRSVIIGFPLDMY